MENISFLFLPFSVDEKHSFADISRKISSHPQWEEQAFDCKYLFNYVSKKISSDAHCTRVTLKEEARHNAGLLPPEAWYSTEAHEVKGATVQFRFRVLSVELDYFSTSIGILIYKLQFENDDPLEISTAQYFLKKVSQERWISDDTQETATSIAKRLLDSSSFPKTTKFFYFANPETERANMLTYVTVPAVEEGYAYEKELYYLRHCYNHSYPYSANVTDTGDSTYIPTPGIYWGISSEATACLACPEMGDEKFIRNTFRKNFQEQYFLMYILLLHQRYVLYSFLSKIDSDQGDNLKVLERYQDRLYEFETNFVFSRVTEVPQYQQLYNAVSTAFSLKEMYEDVREPLIALSETRRKHREDKTNLSLLLLSVLSLFSAFADGMSVPRVLLDGFSGSPLLCALQILCAAIVAAVGVVAFVNLLKKK